MALLHQPRDQPALSFRLTRTYGCQNTRSDTQLRLGTASKNVDDDSGICSPPLWRTSPPTSPQQRKNYYRSLSPASRTQAVARGQKELMDMVQNMPECAYELSLKDLVERPWVDAREENNSRDRDFNSRHGRKRNNDVGKAKKGGNMDRGGFYLKMMFPASLGSKKKKNETSANGSSKVSPRHSLSEGSVKGTDKDWWKKSLSASGGSDSGVSTVNSGSMKSSAGSSGSSRSNSRHESSGDGCWPFLSFIRKPKSLTQKS